MKNKTATETHLTTEELNALLTHYDREARRMRGKALKTLYVEFVAGLRNAFTSLLPYPRNVAHASE